MGEKPGFFPDGPTPQLQEKAGFLSSNHFFVPYTGETSKLFLLQRDSIMAQLTLNLPDSLVERVRCFGQATQRGAEAVLADTLMMMWPAWEDLLNRDLFPPVEGLSDAEILELADLKMDPVRNERLGELQSRGKISGLTVAEQFELLVLVHFYQIGQLRKSEGLAEAVRRGPRGAMPS